MTAGYGSFWYPESEWFERNLERLLAIEEDAYRQAYLDGVRVARGKPAADKLRAAYQKAIGVTA